MELEKWQALGNDYLIVEDSELPFALTPARIRRLCAAHTGIGSDGILLLSLAGAVGGGKASDRNRGDAADSLAGALPAGTLAAMRVFNPDGSESNLSGNGAREAVLYLRRHHTTENRFSIVTKAGEVRATITSSTSCTIEMGRASLTSDDYPGGRDDGRGRLHVGGTDWDFQHVNVGNPQCSIELSSAHQLQELDLAAFGPGIERHPAFPNRTNVSWYVGLAPGRIRARIFERGVGETSASGTGASGAAVAHVLRGGASPVTVVLDGGELEVEVGDDLDLRLSGSAQPVMRLTLAPELLEELDASE